MGGDCRRTRNTAQAFAGHKDGGAGLRISGMIPLSPAVGAALHPAAWPGTRLGGVPRLGQGGQGPGLHRRGQRGVRAVAALAEQRVDHLGQRHALHRVAHHQRLVDVEVQHQPPAAGGERPGQSPPWPEPVRGGSGMGQQMPGTS